MAASKNVSSGLPAAAVFSPWFGLAAVGALILLVALWNTQYRTIAILLATAVALGWVLRYYPVVRGQVAATGDYVAGVTPTGQKG